MQGHTSRGVTRRNLSRAGWSVPALVLLPVARAEAASCAALPSVAFQGSWSEPLVDGFAGRGWTGFRDGAFGGDDDPAQGNLSAFVQTGIQLTLEPNTSYRLSFPVLLWDQSHQQTADIFISGDPGGNFESASTDFPSPGTFVYDFTTDSSPIVDISLTFYIAQDPDGVVPGDDIAIGSPTLECV